MGELKMGKDADLIGEKKISKEQTESKEEKEKMDPKKEQETQIKLLDESIGLAAESARKTKEDLAILRGKFNISSGGEMESASDQYLNNLKKKKESLLKNGEQADLEQANQEEYGVPEGEMSDSKKHKIQVSPEGSIDGIDFKQELKESRENYLQEFIEDSKKKIQEDFRQMFDESKNGERAEEIIIRKIESAVRDKGQDFVENGGDPNFGFSAEINGAQYENPDGTKTQYITGFEMEFLDTEEIKIGEDDARTEGLVNKQEESKLRKLKKQDKLEKFEGDSK